MKKIYTTLFLCLLMNLVFAQNERYDFESSIEAYASLSMANELDFEPNSDWADFEELLELEVNFGFSVPILGFPAVELFNFLTPELLVTSFDEDVMDPILPFLIPITTQLQNRGVAQGMAPSQILFQTTGTPGSQIFKLEYRNVGFANEWFLDTPSQDMFANMQVWIYEGSGCIEFRYGESSITDEDLVFDGEGGASAGLSRNLSSQFDGDTVLYAILTIGDAQNPEVFEGENTTAEPALAAGFPGNGLVYTFCPEIDVNTNNLDTALDWEVYPNPTVDFLTVKLNDLVSANYSLISMNGQKVRSGKLTDGQQKVDVQDLAAGIYTLTVQTDNGIATKRFWKQ